MLLPFAFTLRSNVAANLYLSTSSATYYQVRARAVQLMAEFDKGLAFESIPLTSMAMTATLI